MSAAAQGEEKLAGGGSRSGQLLKVRKPHLPPDACVISGRMVSQTGQPDSAGTPSLL